jgi:hypothetical protein
MSNLYHNDGDVITIRIEDSSRRKVGNWKFNTSNIPLANSILKYLQDKYGFNINSNKKEKDNFWNG